MAVCPFCLPCPRTSVTVMPAMPSAASASLTASTLSGRTIAFNSFTLHPRSRCVDVRLFAVSREIDADLFIIPRCSKREDEGDDFQQHECQNTTVDDGRSDGDRLGHKLTR